MKNNYLDLIRNASVYDVAIKTPLDFAPLISKRMACQIWFKREDFQPVFSYKIRGAYNLMSSLSEEMLGSEVIAASAGNHAQGVALSAKKLGVKATIVMPKTTPEIKVEAVISLGGEVILHGNSYDEASEYAKKYALEKNISYIPPYDHPLIIAGQGTVGLEILDQSESIPDAIFIPVGGGGLISGVAAYVKAIAPHVKIIGVEPAEAASMTAALSAGERVILDQIGIFADGAAVKQVGEENFRIAQEYVDEMLTVSIDEMCAAVKDIFEETRSIAEPAGALALAGAKQYIAKHPHVLSTCVTILSGANVNFDRLRHIAELAELGEQREILIGATLPEVVGSFKDFCYALGPRLITEFNYRMSNKNTAAVFAGVKVKNRDKERALLMTNLFEKGYKPIDMTDNEVAKMHLRFMVGGPSGVSIENERLLRFEFPERAGALLHFLSHLGNQWNISLFHYRNHGAAYGRVLMGIQVPEADLADFETMLSSLGFPYKNETMNPAYHLFLN
jgi:threonine dehydratase